MTTTETETRTTEVFRIYIKATPEAIWEAITSKEWNGRYGYHAPAEYDLKPGGPYRCFATDEMKRYGNTPDVVVDGDVLEADPPNRLVQTWRMHFEPAMVEEGFTTVTWDIRAESDKLCQLTVTHDVTDAPIMAHQITADGPLGEGGGGWAWIISDLKSLLESGNALEL
jgi:uncharacterized protein YndB with AHSA1/START domain